MKKSIAFVAFAVVVASAGYRYSHQSASIALSPVERESLHDSPNDLNDGEQAPRIDLQGLGLDTGNAAPIATPTAAPKASPASGGGFGAAQSASVETVSIANVPNESYGNLAPKVIAINGSCTGWGPFKKCFGLKFYGTVGPAQYDKGSGTEKTNRVFFAAPITEDKAQTILSQIEAASPVTTLSGDPGLIAEYRSVSNPPCQFAELDSKCGGVNSATVLANPVVLGTLTGDANDTEKVYLVKSLDLKIPIIREAPGATDSNYGSVQGVDRHQYPFTGLY
jgi:hypothetical protein